MNFYLKAQRTQNTDVISTIIHILLLVVLVQVAQAQAVLEQTVQVQAVQVAQAQAALEQAVQVQVAQAQAEDAILQLVFTVHTTAQKFGHLEDIEITTLMNIGGDVYLSKLTTLSHQHLLSYLEKQNGLKMYGSLS